MLTKQVATLDFIDQHGPRPVHSGRQAGQDGDKAQRGRRRPSQET